MHVQCGAHRICVCSLCVRIALIPNLHANLASSCKCVRVGVVVEHRLQGRFEIRTGAAVGADEGQLCCIGQAIGSAAIAGDGDASGQGRAIQAQRFISDTLLDGIQAEVVKRRIKIERDHRLFDTVHPVHIGDREVGVEQQNSRAAWVEGHAKAQAGVVNACGRTIQVHHGCIVEVGDGDAHRARGRRVRRCIAHYGHVDCGAFQVGTTRVVGLVPDVVAQCGLGQAVGRGTAHSIRHKTHHVVAAQQQRAACRSNQCLPASKVATALVNVEFPIATNLATVAHAIDRHAAFRAVGR